MSTVFLGVGHFATLPRKMIILYVGPINYYYCRRHDYNIIDAFGVKFQNEFIANEFWFSNQFVMLIFYFCINYVILVSNFHS